MYKDVSVVAAPEVRELQSLSLEELQLEAIQLEAQVKRAEAEAKVATLRARLNEAKRKQEQALNLLARY